MRGAKGGCRGDVNEVILETGSFKEKMVKKKKVEEEEFFRNYKVVEKRIGGNLGFYKIYIYIYKV